MGDARQQRRGRRACARTPAPEQLRPRALPRCPAGRRTTRRAGDAAAGARSSAPATSPWTPTASSGSRSRSGTRSRASTRKRRDERLDAGHQDLRRSRPCTDGTCRRRSPVAGAAAPLSRLPLQMKVRDDGHGNTDIFFTEQAADAIGALRVWTERQEARRAPLPCACMQPLGIALDPNGDIWYSEGTSNRLGRMTLDPTRRSRRQSRSRCTTTSRTRSSRPTPGAQPPNCGGANQPRPAGRAAPARRDTTLPHSVAHRSQGPRLVHGRGERDRRLPRPGQGRPEHDRRASRHARPGQRVRPRAGAGRPRDRRRTAPPSSPTSTATRSPRRRSTATAASTRSSRFRPTARNSLTDSPLDRPAGQPLVPRGGREPHHAHLGRRRRRAAARALAACSSRTPRPGASPARDCRRRSARIDVRVIRGATRRRARRRRPGPGPELRTTTVPLRADDRVEFVPHGAHPPATFSFRVAKLAAGVSGRRPGRRQRPDRLVAARRRRDDRGRPGGPMTAKISADDGSFSCGRPGHGRHGLLDGRHRERRFRTVTPFGWRRAERAARRPAVAAAARARAGHGAPPQPATPRSRRPRARPPAG